MMVGQYKRNEENTKIKQVDATSLTEVAKDFDPLILERNRKIDIIIENNPDLTVYQ
jgi:hypothetical protein